MFTNNFLSLTAHQHRQSTCASVTKQQQQQQSTTATSSSSVIAPQSLIPTPSDKTNSQEQQSTNITPTPDTGAATSIIDGQESAICIVHVLTACEIGYAV